MTTPFQQLQEKEKQRRKLLYWREEKRRAISCSQERKKSQKRSMVIPRSSISNRQRIQTELPQELHSNKKQIVIRQTLRKVTANRYRVNSFNTHIPKNEQVKIVTWMNFHPVTQSIKITEQENKSICISGQKQHPISKQSKSQQNRKSRSVNKSCKKEKKNKDKFCNFRCKKPLNTYEEKLQMQGKRKKYYLYETIATQRSYQPVPLQPYRKVRCQKLTKNFKTTSFTLHKEIQEERKKQSTPGLHIEAWDVHKEDDYIHNDIK